MLPIIAHFAAARAIAFALSATVAETVDYSYDSQGRLIEAAHSGAGSNAGLDIRYQYDLNNNRVTQTVTGSKNSGQQVVAVPLGNGINVIPINP